MKVYDKTIYIQYRDDDKKQWIIFQKLHAHINTAISKEQTNAGVSSSRYTLNFSVRYNKNINKIAFDMQHYRIVHNNVFYRIASYDDFNLQHKTIKLVGESYG